MLIMIWNGQIKDVTEGDFLTQICLINQILGLAVKNVLALTPLSLCHNHTVLETKTD
jgi:hypothetical protein